MQKAPKQTANPRITIITAALNPGPEVAQTIESVLSQEYPDLEYIFVDGGSRDDLFAHVFPYTNRLSLLIREPDGGISAAWNKAIKRATGDIVGIINADDYLLPGALSVMAAAYARHGSSVVVHGDVLRINAGCETLRRSTIPLWLMIRFGTPVFHPATFVPKQIYDTIGTFGESYRVAMDYDLILRAYLARVPFIRVPQPIVGFRHGGVSDRMVLEGYGEVRRSQIENRMNRAVVETIYAAKVSMQKYVRPALSRLIMNAR